MALREVSMGETSKLDGNTNYSVWSFKLRNMLCREDTWKLVEPPPGTIAPTDPAEVAALQVQKNKALTMIALSVRDNVIPYILNITEPDVCWATLKGLYASSTNSRKLLLRRKLTSLKLEEGGSMSTFLQHLKELINELACAGEIIADEEVVEHVLMALPESYEGLVNTITYRPTLPSVAELTVILLQDEIRREIRGQKQGDCEALLVKTKKNFISRKPTSGGDSLSKGKRTPSECHYCGSTSHWMRNCPQLAAELKKRRAERRDKTTINLIDNFESGEDDDSRDSDSELAVNLTELNIAEQCTSQAEWYIDSGASKHVTGRKKLLSEIESGSSSKISTAGGETLNVIGKGKVEIPTNSGGIKFDNVLYVPGVTKNLLSVGTIADDKEGYKILFDSGKVWILRDFPIPDAHHVVTEGHRDFKNGLYKFRPPEDSINSVLPSLQLPEECSVAESVGSATETMLKRATETSHGHTPSFTAESTSSLWHQRLGHANLRTLQYMASQVKVRGLPASITSIPFCEPCHLGKQTRERIPSKVPPLKLCTTCRGLRRDEQGARGKHRSMRPMQLVHTDLCGPMSTHSLSGSRYILTITDDFSRFTWIFFLKTKSETLSKFQQFKSMVELPGKFKLQAIRSDRGGEYTSHAFIKFCDESGIARQLTQAHTPHQNGVAERKNRSLLEKARSMAFACNLPSFLWTEAIATANYVINRTPTRANAGETPYGKLTGSTPDIGHLRVFGCRTLVLDTSPARKKWAPRASACIFLGYDTTSKGYRNYHQKTGRILISKDVRFDEKSFPLLISNTSTLIQLTLKDWLVWSELSSDPGATPSSPCTPCAQSSPRIIDSPSGQANIDPEHITDTTIPSSMEMDHGTESPSSSQHDVPSVASPQEQVHPDCSQFDGPQSIGDFSVQPPICPDTSSQAQIPLHTYYRRHVSSSAQLPRSARSRQPPHHLQDFYLDAVEVQNDPDLPNSIQEAMSHPGWLAAMEDELSSIYKNDTWDLVPLPPDRQAISTKWVFRIKHNADGTIAKFKARLVAKGFQQREGHDYTETFAPVMKWNTLRSVISLAGHQGWTIVHLDVKTAFLNGDIQEDIYVKPPPGYESLTHPHHACKLKKALYGLKQAPRSWYCKIDDYLTGQGLQKSSADQNLYFHEKDGLLTLLILYVDDVYLTGNNLSYIARLRSDIQTAFEMTDLGTLSYSLGIEFLFGPDGIRLTQRRYIESMLADFGLSECRPVATPMVEKTHLVPDMGATPTDLVRYQTMVGKLIFLTHTRPDIAYAVSIVSRFMAAPQEIHAQAVKHIYRYLKVLPTLH